MESEFSSQTAEFEKVLDESKSALAQHSNDCDPMWAPLSRLVKASDDLFHKSLAQDLDIRNLQELKQDLIDELEVISEIDGLTGLWNHRHFARGLDHEIRRSSRSHRPVSMILIEIDFFPEFLEYYGQSASELCLKRVGGQLARVLNRPYDIVAHYDEQQFVCLLPETDSAGSMTVAQSVFRGIADLDILHERSRIGEIVTVSMGLVTRVPGRSDRPQAFVGAIEAALQEARDAGRNRIVANDATPSTA